MRATTLTLTLVGTLSLAAPAWAQSGSSSRGGGSSRGGASSAATPATTPPAGGATATAGTHTATAARLAITRAQTAFVAHDYETALTEFRRAAGQADADRAEATLGVGATLSMRGDADGALNAFREAVRFAVAANDAQNRLRALQAVANRLERSAQWDAAITAWDEFVSVADAHPDLATAANGRARINAIRQRAEFDRLYEPVRTRIQERLRLNAQGPRPQS